MANTSAAHKTLQGIVRKTPATTNKQNTTAHNTTIGKTDSCQNTGAASTETPAGQQPCRSSQHKLSDYATSVNGRGEASSLSEQDNVFGTKMKAPFARSLALMA